MNRLRTASVNLACAAIVLSACEGGSGTADGSDSIRVGLAHPFTGSLATQGSSFEAAMRLAQAQINDHGGIRGHRLELVAKDSATSGEVAGVVAQELIAEGVPAIISGDGSAAALSILDAAAPAGVVFVATTARTVALTRPSNNGLFFRPGPTSIDEAALLARVVVADQFAKMATISNTHPYTSAFASDFGSLFTAGCTTCELVSSGTYPESVDAATFDFKPLVTEALTNGAEAIVFSSYPPDANALFHAAIEVGYQGPLYTTAAAGNENLSSFMTPEQAARVKWPTSKDPSGPGVEFLHQAWLDAGLRAEDFIGPVHTAYDGTFVLGLALAHAQTLDGPTIAASMRTVANPPGTKVYAGEWAKALAAISAGEDIDYVGVASDVDFDDLGNVAIDNVIKTYRDGQSVIVPTP